jgi:DMSO reductase anchor subunit
VGFTLALQVACGISIAIAVAGWIEPRGKAEIAQVLAISVFPIITVGMIVSLLHLGRPSAGWRALIHVRRSRLSVEVLLTLLFGLAAGVNAYCYWQQTNNGFQMGVAALGLASVVASSRIYEVPARAFWNSGWVLTSFLSTTLIVFGLALKAISPGASLAVWVVVLGSFLLLDAAVWMWIKRPDFDLRSGWLVTWFSAYLVLIPPAALLLLVWPSVGFIVPCCAAGVGVVAGRILMFAIAELEPQW